MRSRAYLLTIAACLVACARQSGEQSAAARPQGASGKSEVLVGEEAYKDGEVVLAAWLAYGAAKAKAYFEHPPPAANESADDFATELAARQAQSEFWAKQRKEGAPRHADLDKQVEIWRAGFLPELVIGIHGRPGWTVPPSALGKLRFEEFGDKYAGSYPRGAPIKVKSPSGKIVPEIPGDDFPDPLSLPMSLASCPRLLDERKAAWNRFAQLEPRLGGVAVSADTPVAFAHRLGAAKDETAHRSRGVTWVSSRVGHLATLDGTCAVEHKDWAEAVRMLTLAVSLLPDHPGPRLELALALAALHRYDEGLAQVTVAIGQATTGCVLGQAWRRMGYILIDKGALDTAEVAYKKSLEFDPKSSIALKELQHIADMRRDRGSGKGGAGAGKAEPNVLSLPSTKLSVNICHAPNSGE